MGIKLESDVISRIALGKKGKMANIYQALKYLIGNSYVTGKIINVDGVDV